MSKPPHREEEASSGSETESESEEDEDTVSSYNHYNFELQETCSPTVLQNNVIVGVNGEPEPIIIHD
jgi:hypothetical protein